MRRDYKSVNSNTYRYYGEKTIIFILWLIITDYSID